MADLVRTKDGKVSVVDPSGVAFKVDQSELRTVMQQGYRLDTPDEWNERSKRTERETLGQQALTAVEGAAEGATLGISTAVATGLLGDEYREGAAERAEINPGVRTAGQVLGAVVPALASGGAGTAGAIARATPAGAIARGSAALERAIGGGLARAGVGGAESGLLGTAINRGASLGLSGAVEGAAYGLGSSLAESALEGTDWTAERALAGMGDGALYGLKWGAAIGAGSAVGKRLGGKAVDAMLGGKTLRQHVDEFAANRTVKGLVGDDVRAYRKLTRDGSTPERIQELAQKIRDRGIAKADDVGKAVQREIDDADQISRTIENAAESRGIRPTNVTPLRDEVRKQVAELKEVGTPEHRAIARLIEKRAAPLFRSARTASPDGTVTRTFLEPTAGELRTFKTRLGEVTKNFTGPSRSLADKASGALYGKVASALEETADAMGPEAGTAYRAAMRDMDDFITVRGAMKRESTRKLQRKFVQSGEVQSGLGGALASLVMGASGPMAILAGAATSVAHKLIRERGERALGKLADWAIETERGMRNTARSIVGVGGSAERSVVRGLVAAHAPESKDPAQDFQDVRGAVIAFQTDPTTVEKKIQAAIEPIAREQPEVAFAMGRRIADDYAWLSSKMPATMTRVPTSLTPHREKPAWNKREEKRIVSYATALARPAATFASVQADRVDWDGLEALKERRPELWNAMRSHVIEAAAEAEEPIPFRKRILLGLAFDFPSDWSMANVAEIQGMGSAPQPNQGSGRPAMAGITTSQYDLPQEQPTQ